MADIHDSDATPRQQQIFDSKHVNELAAVSSRAVLSVPALLAGITAAGGAMYMLVSNALELGKWESEHTIMIVTISVTILLGHIVQSSARDRKWLTAAFCAAMFILGTCITVLNGLGRQTETTNQKYLAAEEINKRRADEETSLARNKAMLDEEMKKQARECEVAKSSACTKLSITVNTYKDAVKGNMAELEKIGPTRSIDARGSKIAEIVTLMGGNGDSAKRLINAVAPFATSLFLELVSIVSFGYATSHKRPAPRVAPAVEAPATVREKAPAGDFMARLTKLSTNNILDTTQAKLAAELGMSQPTVSKRLKSAEADGLVVVTKTSKGTRIEIKSRVVRLAAG